MLAFEYGRCNGDRFYALGYVDQLNRTQKCDHWLTTLIFFFLGIKISAGCCLFIYFFLLLFLDCCIVYFVVYVARCLHFLSFSNCLGGRCVFAAFHFSRYLICCWLTPTVIQVNSFITQSGGKKTGSMIRSRSLPSLKIINEQINNSTTYRW